MPYCLLFLSPLANSTSNSLPNSLCLSKRYCASSASLGSSYVRLRVKEKLDF